MLRISKLADYGSSIMRYLVLMAPQAPSASQIALATNIALPTVRKVLKHLQMAKLLTASRGKDGGYQLALPETEITLADIVEAVDGAIAITDCCITQPDCQHQHHCTVQDSWQMINKIVKDALQQCYLSDFSRGRMPQHELSER